MKKLGIGFWVMVSVFCFLMDRVEAGTATYQPETNTIVIEGTIKATPEMPALAWIAKNLTGTTPNKDFTKHIYIAHNLPALPGYDTAHPKDDNVDITFCFPSLPEGDVYGKDFVVYVDGVDISKTHQVVEVPPISKYQVQVNPHTGAIRFYPTDVPKGKVTLSYKKTVLSYDPSTKTAILGANLEIRGVLEMGIADGSYQPMNYINPTTKGKPDEILKMEKHCRILNYGILIANESELDNVSFANVAKNDNYKFVRCKLSHINGFLMSTFTKVYFEDCEISNFSKITSDPWNTWDSAVVSITGCAIHDGEEVLYAYHPGAKMIIRDNLIYDCKRGFHLLAAKLEIINSLADNNIVKAYKGRSSMLTVKWWLTIKVVDEKGNPIPNRRLVIKCFNKMGDTEYSGVKVTDKNGEVKIALTEKVYKDGTDPAHTTVYTPHTISIRSGTFKEKTEVRMNDNNTITLCIK